MREHYPRPLNSGGNQRHGVGAGLKVRANALAEDGAELRSEGFFRSSSITTFFFL